MSSAPTVQLPVLYWSRLRLFNDVRYNLLPPDNTPVFLIIILYRLVAKVVEAASHDRSQPDFVHLFFNILRRAKKEGRLIFIRDQHLEDYALLSPMLKGEGLPTIDTSWLLKTSFIPRDICPAPTSIYQGKLEIRV
jgi:hypothetical protein